MARWTSIVEGSSTYVRLVFLILQRVFSEMLREFFLRNGARFFEVFLCGSFCGPAAPVVVHEEVVLEQEILSTIPSLRDTRVNIFPLLCFFFEMICKDL